MATETLKSAANSDKSAHKNDATSSTSGASISEIMLHGTLKVIVHEAKNLENSKFISDAMDKCWACCTYPARRKGRLIPVKTAPVLVFSRFFHTYELK